MPEMHNLASISEYQGTLSKLRAIYDQVIHWRNERVEGHEIYDVLFDRNIPWSENRTDEKA